MVVLVGLLAAVASVIGQASAASPAATSLRCSLQAQLKSGQISVKGTLVGSVTCGHPFGKGSYHGRYRDSVEPSPFTGSETGSSTFAFKAGIVRGTYTIPQAPISGTAPYHGTFHITGGTGRFRHASGTLKLTCTHRIPPLTNCTVSGPVTRSSGSADAMD
jgi:hypothetical protein